MDFLPAKEYFRVAPVGAGLDDHSTVVRTKDLKAVFFVKDFDGNPAHVDTTVFDPERRLDGSPIRVVFNDGEVLVGTTNTYQAERQGFILEPADPLSNNLRAFVVSDALQEIVFM
jgi:hypothetical protein